MSIKHLGVVIDGVRYDPVKADCDMCSNCAFRFDGYSCDEARDYVDCYDHGIFWKKVDTTLPFKEETTTGTAPPKENPSDIRSYNVGTSNYAKHKIQPWDIWLEYKLNPWDADIIKRVLRHKAEDPRRLDYEKIIHICQERIRQIDLGLE
jgi:hypothetical protein